LQYGKIIRKKKEARACSKKEKLIWKKGLSSTQTLRKEESVLRKKKGFRMSVAKTNLKVQPQEGGGLDDRRGGEGDHTKRKWAALTITQNESLVYSPVNYNNFTTNTGVTSSKEEGKAPNVGGGQGRGERLPCSDICEDNGSVALSSLRREGFKSTSRGGEVLVGGGKDASCPK